ncbi:MAG: peptide/nickel transport system substrate-binding protein [Gammaproteobacteria bacterium]
MIRFLVVFICLSQLSYVVNANALIETPFFEDRIKQGELLSIADRLPEQPEIVSFEGDFRPGEHGGQLRLLMGKQKDIRQITVYGYARLIGYTLELELKADILESVDVEGERIFTLHIRKGHKWSDGHPFTSEDFRYYWEDIANNAELSNGGPSKKLTIDGELPVVDIIDELTVRYSWSQPNPFFLPALAGASPLYIYAPAHYLRQFHRRYQTKERLAELVEQYQSRDWVGVHINRDRPYKATNPDLPTLQPWVNTTFPPSERFIFERNPYYYRIDSNGRQLPYIDTIAVNIASGKLIPAKTGANESDLQARYLRMDNYTFLKQSEKRSDYEVRLWSTAKGANIALFPNLNAKNPAMRSLFQDVRFRKALSLAIHRHEINQVVYFGLALEGNNTVLPASPLFKPEYQTTNAEFDLKQANQLLDALGLVNRDDRNVRLLPDGSPLEIMIQTAGESTEETDILELIHDSWLAAGIKLYSIPSTREVFRNRIFSGDAMMSIWSGMANGLPRANSSPAALAATSRYQYQWPQWGQYYESGGTAGEEPQLAEVKQLMRLNHDWRMAVDKTQRESIWHEMLKIHQQQMFSIGIIAGVRQPVVVNQYLQNVPAFGFYDMQPGAYFGIYKPDTFWFSEGRR